MPPRRPHTKSRSGCRRCKEKHIKCDEARPACGACVRYNVPCLPKLPKPQRSLQAISSPAPSTSPSFASSQARNSLTLWEFELLHHWTVRVADSFDISPRFHDAWRDRGVKEAIRHDFILHMILVLSALHLALTNDPSFTETHRAFILEGCSDATTRFREEAGSPSEYNCHAVRAFPFLLTIYAFALAQLDGGVRGEQAVLDEMIHIMVLVKGHVLVEDTTQPFIALRNDDWIQKEDVISSDQGCLDFDAKLLDALVDLESWIESSSDSPAVKACNLESLRSFTKVPKLNLHTNLQPHAWPCDVKSDYLELLGQRNPLALAILAHYAVILWKCSSQWWCSNWGAQLLSVIAAILPAQYRDAISWPLQMVSPGDEAASARPHRERLS